MRGRCGWFLQGILLVAVVSILVSCYTYKVDTVPKWCEQNAGVDLEKKHGPWWAAIFAVSFDGDAIRDDYATPAFWSYLTRAKALLR